jgi:hypothetical protein
MAPHRGKTGRVVAPLLKQAAFAAHRPNGLNEFVERLVASNERSIANLKLQTDQGIRKGLYFFLEKAISLSRHLDHRMVLLTSPQ